jgi:anti-sigma factor RsiW
VVVVAEPTEDLDLLIEQYMDGQMDPRARAAFEERLRKDPELSKRVNDQTRSMEMIQDALGALTPSEEFDTRVNSKIISITQSRMQPAAAASGRPLSGQDPDSKLLGDPEATREKKRLIAIAAIVLLVFAVAATAVIYALNKNRKPPAQTK